MVASKLDLYMEQGADWNWSLTYTDTTVDLTGYAARLQSRATVDAVTTILNLHSTSTGISINIPSRKISVSLPASITAALTTINSVYDLELIYPSGKVERLVEGKITLAKEVTR